MDAESWYSVTPEKIAVKMAQHCLTSHCKCKSKVAKSPARQQHCSCVPVVLDAFLGSGGNMVQLALAGAQVTGVEIDPVKIQHAKHNARLYGINVENQCEFILGDFISFARSWCARDGVAAHGRCDNRAWVADVILISPPWGGPTYRHKAMFDIQSMVVSGCDGCELLEMALQMAPAVVYYLPINTDREQINQLAQELDVPVVLQVRNNRKLVECIEAY
jgi:trimethylguanosine synthase